MPIERKQRSANEVIWYDQSLINEPLDNLFDPHYWQELGRVLGSASGRGTTWFIQTNSSQAALRHYRRGGLFGKVIKDQYWFNSFENTRSFKELTLLNHLIASGVHVPRPLAARAIKVGLFYKADLLSEKIANAHDLVSILTKRSLSPNEYQRIGQEIALMHVAGVNHTDLNIHNIMLDDSGSVWIIDFDKCSIGGHSDWKQSNIKRLHRSFKKELNKRQILWNNTDFTALLNGYNQQ